MAGPVAWVVWNRFAHGEALHFVARVTAYRRALGEGANEGVLARLGAYPVAFAREMPEVVVPFAIAVAMAVVPQWRAAILARLQRSAAPLGLAAVQVAALATALVKDGAPTHHPERAVLFPALAMAVFVADVAVGIVSGALSRGVSRGWGAPSSYGARRGQPLGGRGPLSGGGAPPCGAESVAEGTTSSTLRGQPLGGRGPLSGGGAPPCGAESVAEGTTVLDVAAATGRTGSAQRRRSSALRSGVRS